MKVEADKIVQVVGVTVTLTHEEARNLLNLSNRMKVSSTNPSRIYYDNDRFTLYELGIKLNQILSDP